MMKTIRIMVVKKSVIVINLISYLYNNYKPKPYAMQCITTETLMVEKILTQVFLRTLRT